MTNAAEDRERAVAAAWAAEIDRRIERIRRGQAKGRSWEEVRSDLEQRFTSR